MAASAAPARDVVLRDGRTLRLRAPTRGDAAAVTAFLERLSERSRYLRFHGHTRVGPPLVDPLLDPDFAEVGALVGLVGDAGGERIVALASFARLRDPTAAEVAFAVADELQGHGAGTRLLEQLAELAAAAGVERFVADVLPQNAPMLRLFDDAGFASRRRFADGVVEVELGIRATERYLESVDARDHRGVVASLRPFFAPATVAVVGASSEPGSLGGDVFRNVLAGDFAGAAFPVNHDGRSVAGVAAHARVADIPHPVDLAVVCVPGEQVLDAAAEALAADVRALCVLPGGFAETGPAGAARQDELLALVRSHGARLIGPNCLGLAVGRRRLNATVAPRRFPPGPCAVSSQSGALGLALLERAEERGLGVSSFVTLGNRADVSTNDLLEHWEDDDDSRVVLLHLESFGNPRRFSRIARRVARRKPILALKGGAAGADAVDALFRQAGVLRAGTLEELLDAAVLLATQPLPPGRRVAVLTNAGGLGRLCADACSAAGLEPLEPVRLGATATAEGYEAALRELLEDEGNDAVIALAAPPAAARAVELAATIAAVAADIGAAARPLLACVLGAPEAAAALRAGPRPVADFRYPEAAARALGLAATRAEWLRRPHGAVPELAGLDRAAARTVVAAALAGAEEASLGPGETVRLLAAYGVALTPDAVRPPGGVELAVGVVQDPVFGPLVAFGVGGLLRELVGQPAYRIAPLTDVDAAELVQAGPAGRLARGLGGAPPVDEAALAELLVRLAQLGADLPELAGLELDPLLASPDGYGAVSARARLQRPAERASPKTW